MIATIRRSRATVGAAAVLILLAAGLVRASEPALRPVTQFLSADGTSLADAWQPAVDALTVVVIHGFRARGTDEGFLRQAAAIQQRLPRADVVIVDWHLPSAIAAEHDATERRGWGFAAVWSGIHGLGADYHAAVAATRHVAGDIAEWMQRHRIDPAQTVLCGHSLGAHIAGFTGRDVASRAGRSLAAILAADPAGPLFRNQGPEGRLDRTDAREVIVIHTTDGLGYDDALGTVDVYVTWPELQTPDMIARHSHARELVTESFLRAEMVCSAGRPFGANGFLPALAAEHADPGRDPSLTLSLPTPAGNAGPRLATSARGVR